MNDESKKIFLKEMADVRPLKNDHKNKVNLSQTKKNNKIIVKQRHSQMESSLKKNDFIDVMPLAAEKILSCQKQISNQTFNDLKQGKVVIDARLDLHKSTCDEASTAVIKFLNQCHMRSVKCAIIVHGKGQGLLKGVTESILNKSVDVLAFHSAISSDGGTGAVYILL